MQSMHPLQYDARAERGTWREISAQSCLALCLLPLTAGALGMLAAGLAMAEPFFAVRMADVAVFVGAPAAISVLGLTWWRLARRHRLRKILILPVLGWFALAAFGAARELVLYLQDLQIM